jgi:hypothetical protein
MPNRQLTTAQRRSTSRPFDWNVGRRGSDISIPTKTVQTIVTLASSSLTHPNSHDVFDAPLRRRRRQSVLSDFSLSQNPPENPEDSRHSGEERRRINEGRDLSRGIAECGVSRKVLLICQNQWKELKIIVLIRRSVGRAKGWQCALLVWRREIVEEEECELSALNHDS